MTYFWTKYMFELKKYTGVIFYDTEGWCKIWRKIDLWFGKWPEQFGKFLPEYSKVSQLRLWWDPFIQSRKYMRLKFTEKLRVLTMKKDAKFGEELTCGFKIELRNLMNFGLSARKSQKNCALMGCFWPKYIMFGLKKVQRSYVWWHWRVMQNLKENWLVLSKMTRIWQIFAGWKIAISF